MRFGLRKVEAVAVFGSNGELELGALGRSLWAKKRWIILPTLIVGVLAFIAVNLMAPRYKSEARVLLEGRENIFLRPEAEKALIERSVIDQEAITSQVQLVLSRDLARDVIARLKLDQLPEFDPALRGVSPLSTMLILAGLSKDPLRVTAEERVLDAYYDRLSVFAVDKSRVIAIEFRSTDPEVAAKVANAVATGYLGLQQVAKQEQTRAAGSWLSGEIDKLRGRVSEAEAKVEQFRAKSNLFVGPNNTNLSNQGLGEFTTQLAAARTQKADSETRARLLRETLRSGQPVEASEIANSDLIRRLSEQRVTLRAQLAEQSSTLLGQHPRIKELKAQIADLDGQIRGEAEKLVRGLESDAKIASARLDSLTAAVDQLKRQAASSNVQDVQLRELEREAKAQRDLFESYLAKYREASARESIAAAPADARIISHASVSNVPYFPKKVPIVLIASLATFVLSAGFVATGALLGGASAGPSRRVTENAEAAPAPDTMAPAMRTGPRGLVQSSLSIHDIAQVLRQAGDAGKRVAVLGNARNAGTTVTAIALARTLARHARVILIDLAFNAPNLAVVSNEPGAPGMADLLRGSASFGHVITRDRFSGLHLVSAGHAREAAMLGGIDLATAIDALSRTYDHLVIDAGAVAETDVAAIARLAPRAVLVERDAGGGKAARDQLLAGGFRDVSVVVADLAHLGSDHPAAA